MKKLTLLTLALLGLFLQTTFAAGIDTIKRDGYTLIVSGNDEHFGNSIREKLISTFFIVYP